MMQLQSSSKRNMPIWHTTKKFLGTQVVQMHSTSKKKCSTRSVSVRERTTLLVMNTQSVAEKYAHRALYAPASASLILSNSIR